MRARLVGGDTISVGDILLALDWISVNKSERYKAVYFDGSTSTFDVSTDVLLLYLWKGWRVAFEQVSS